MDGWVGRGGRRRRREGISALTSRDQEVGGGEQSPLASAFSQSSAPDRPSAEWVISGWPILLPDSRGHSGLHTWAAGESRGPPELQSSHSGL